MSSYHTVAQGETLSGIALSYGFQDWRKVYDHPTNADFRRRRPNPNVIFPGDRIFIPDKTAKSAILGTTRTHTFVLRSATQFLGLVIQDGCWHAVANEDYELRVGGQTHRGRTRADGRVVHEIPPTASSAELTVRGHTWKLDIGHLNPVEDDTSDHGVSGAQGRLLNMGYEVGPLDGDPGPKTEKSMLQFQSDFGLTRSGTLDAPTRAKLKEAHGC